MPYPHMFAEEFAKKPASDPFQTQQQRPLNEPTQHHNIRRLKHAVTADEPGSGNMHSLIQSRSFGVKVVP